MYGGNVGYQIGGAGTIFTKADAATYGDLLVDNNSQNGVNTTTVESSTFDNLTIRNTAKYVIANTHTITTPASTMTTTANASMTINSGGTFTANSLTTITNFQLINNSTLSLPAFTTMSGFTMTNNSLYNHSGSTLTISSGCTWYENGTNPAIGNTQAITDIVLNGTMEFQNQNTTGSAVSFNTITINSGGNLTHQANTTTQTDGLNLSLTTLTVNTGGTINVNGKGYAGGTVDGNGPGKG